jgi:hypothetical protein
MNAKITEEKCRIFVFTNVLILPYAW